MESNFFLVNKWNQIFADVSLRPVVETSVTYVGSSHMKGRIKHSKLQNIECKSKGNWKIIIAVLIEEKTYTVQENL